MKMGIIHQMTPILSISQGLDDICLECGVRRDTTSEEGATENFTLFFMGVREEDDNARLFNVL